MLLLANSRSFSLTQSITFNYYCPLVIWILSYFGILVTHGNEVLFWNLLNGLFQFFIEFLF